MTATLSGFQAFLTSQVGISVAPYSVVPTRVGGLVNFIRGGLVNGAPEPVGGTSSALLTMSSDGTDVVSSSYALAVATVNPDLAQASDLIYTLAVYNLATDYVINMAPDPSGSTYFTDIRSKFNLNTFTAGLVESSSDSSTSASLGMPASLKELTISDLQNMKTPWGRQYLAFAQKYGTLWGLS